VLAELAELGISGMTEAELEAKQRVARNVKRATL
jgi:hypothetical protein